MVGPTEVVRSARTGAMIWPNLGIIFPRSRLTHQLVVAVEAAEAAPFSLEVGPDLVLETSVAGKVTLPIRAVRRGGFKGSISGIKPYGCRSSPATRFTRNRHFSPRRPKSRRTRLRPNSRSQSLWRTPPGTHSFFLSGVGTVNYVRSPEALKAAHDRKAVVEKIVADDAAAAKVRWMRRRQPRKNERRPRPPP